MMLDWQFDFDKMPESTPVAIYRALVGEIYVDTGDPVIFIGVRGGPPYCFMDNSDVYSVTCSEPIAWAYVDPPDPRGEYDLDRMNDFKDESDD